MNPVVLLMLMALLGADATAATTAPQLTGWAMPVSVCGTLAAIACAAWLVTLIGARLLDRHPAQGARVVERVHLVLGVCRWATLLVFVAAAHLLGWVAWINQAMSVHVLVADTLAVAPALLTVAFTWWAYQPIDRRLRQVSLVGQLDRGDPVAGAWSRWRYTMWQVRHQMGLFVLLLGGLLVWTHVVSDLLPLPPSQPWVEAALTFAALPIGLAAAPLMIRWMWDIEPLGAGPLRDRLTALCDEHGVRVRRLLVWRTTGGIINAAVVGFVGRLRYIIVTDGMIERLRDEEIEAIMAHEIGHVVRRHLPWMLICAIALLSAATLIVDTAAQGLFAAIAFDPSALSQPAGAALDGAVLMSVLGIWAAAFGVVSRRMERQADTFAAQHLAARWPDTGFTPGVIGPTPASIVAETLRRVAVLNHIPIRRRAWRHGSIASRIEYLTTLIGKPVDACPIDALVRRTCFACLLLLIVAMIAMTYADGGTTI